MFEQCLSRPQSMDLSPRSRAARGLSIAANTSSAAADNSGTVRAIWPIRTMHSSSATSAAVEITSWVGAVWSGRRSMGRVSGLDMRPSERAAAIATGSCKIFKQCDEDRYDRRGGARARAGACTNGWIIIPEQREWAIRSSSAVLLLRPQL
jgi:hypothetical protein